MHHPTDATAFVTPVVEHWLEREIYSKQMWPSKQIWPSAYWKLNYE